MSHRVLLIPPPGAAWGALVNVLDRLDVKAEIAPDGCFVLTMLERAGAEAIVSGPTLPDMRPEELRAIVTSDPALGEVRFLGVGRSDGELNGAFDRVFDADQPPAVLARRIHSVLQGAPQDHAVALRGSLGLLSFSELLRGIAHLSKTGCLLCEVQGGTARLYFRDGEVVGAELGALSGPSAFERILAVATRHGGGSFEFWTLPSAELGSLEKPFEDSLEHALLRIAVDLDESTAPWLAGGE